MRREHWYNCIKISVESDDDLYKIGVVPYAGTWIETNLQGNLNVLVGVVPYAGTWIETVRENYANIVCYVVPYAGTWIETLSTDTQISLHYRRSLRGNVD